MRDNQRWNDQKEGKKKEEKMAIGEREDDGREAARRSPNKGVTKECRWNHQQERRRIVTFPQL